VNRATPRVAVGCVRWGTRYGPDYVNVLYRAVGAHMRHPFRFVCITEEMGGLDPGVQAVPFPDFGVPRPQWNKGSWPKVPLFAPGIFADDEIVLYLDLDVMVLGDLDPFIDLVRERPAFYTLRESSPIGWRLAPLAWRPDRGSQGSVYVWRAGDQRHVWEHFTTHTDYVRANFHSDRFYFPKIAVGETYLPDGWCRSFKAACAWYWPLSLVFRTPAYPEGARILFFHGRPRPIELMGPPGRRWGSKRKSGTGPVPWVRDYWTRYGGRLPEATP
jgi:hypothetical protein